MRLCKNHGCSIYASFGWRGISSAEFCVKHKSTGMVVTIGKLCSYRGCPRLPSYGAEGSRKMVFCNEHKEAGMVNVRCKRCAHQGCSVRASFGKGGKKPEFCGEHKEAGMMNVNRKRCAYSGCSKLPYFGREGSKNAVFCSEHKASGMLDVRSGSCAYSGCSGRAYYGKKGSRKVEMCGQHKTTGMVHVFKKTCVSEGCDKWACKVDGGRHGSMYCCRHFVEINQAQESAVPSADAREVDDNNDERTGGQVFSTSSRKRPLGVVRATGQVQQTSESVGGIAPGLAIPASPATLVAAEAAAQSSGGALATELPTPASVAASSNTFHGATGEREVHDAIGVCRQGNEGVRAVAIRDPGFVNLSIVVIKHEDEEAQES